MECGSSIGELVRRRRSCRRYLEAPLAAEAKRSLEAFLAADCRRPFARRTRLTLIAATGDDHTALRGLGTYGFIRGAVGFLAGGVERGRGDLEDFGFVMERAILRATDLGLGTCWLGGTFTKSRFARRIVLTDDELMPAVAAIGYPAGDSPSRDRARQIAGSDFRLPPEQLFFDAVFGGPLSPDRLGAYAGALDLVRWAPSASNRQPWRIVRTETGWHFFLARSRGYGKGTPLFAVLRLADLQRVDMGIAMCHFELAAREAGLEGAWVIDDPGIATPHPGVEYTATWRPTR